VTNYETVMEFIDNRVCDSGYQARYDAALTALEEMRRDSGRLADVRRALIEITEYSTGWTHNCEGMCLLRIDDLARSSLNEMKGGDAPRPLNLKDSQGRSDAPEDWFAAAGVSACTIRETKAQEQSTAGASADAPSIPFYQEAQPPECAARKILRRIYPYLERVNHIHLEHGEPCLYAFQVYDALANSCPCEELRAENAKLNGALECAIAAAKRRGAERNQLRDTLAQIGAHHLATLGEVRKELESAFRVGDQLLNERDDALRARDLAREQISEAEKAINATMEGAGWMPSSEEHHASRVTFLTNLYSGAVHTIGLLHDQRNQLRADLATEKAAREKAEKALAEAVNVIHNIRRFPALPFPDPEAHSHRAFGDAVFRAYSDIQRCAVAFVAAHSKEKEK
jgi:hypothetical protein